MKTKVPALSLALAGMVAASTAGDTSAKENVFRTGLNGAQPSSRGSPQTGFEAQQLCGHFRAFCHGVNTYYTKTQTAGYADRRWTDSPRAGT